MESAQILAIASGEEDVPHDWLVLPLLRQKVIVGILGWLLGFVLGGILFAFMAPIMIPHNYTTGIGSVLISTILLGIVLFVCLGSLWAMIVDLRRVTRAREHIIVITPEDFVKQEGNKVIHVPLEYVTNVTARGAPPVDRSLETARQDTQMGSRSGSIAGLFLGRRNSRGASNRRERALSSLVFIDSRAGQAVTVATDKSYGDPYAIAAHLKEYSAARAQKFV